MQAVVGSLIAALFLQWAAKVVVKETPTYKIAYLCSFLPTLISGFLGLGVGMLATPAEESAYLIDAPMVILFFVGLIISAWFVSHYLSLTFLKGLHVVLMQLVLVALVIGVPLAILMVVLLQLA